MKVMDTHTYKLKAAIFISPVLRRVYYNLATPLPPGIYILSEKFLVGERRAIKIISLPPNLQQSLCRTEEGQLNAAVSVIKV